MSSDFHSRFIEAASVPREVSHASGSLDEAQTILAAHPEVARASIHSAAVMGDDVTVRELLATEPALAGATGGPRAWDPLTYLCYADVDALVAAARVVQGESVP
jgi:hypothetical protein